MLASEPTTLSRVRAWVLAAMTLQCVLLLATGVALFFVYRPSGSAAYGELLGDNVGSSINRARAVTAVHQLSAVSAVPTAMIAGVLSLIEKRRPWLSRRVDVLVATSTALVAVLGSVTGYRLAWDQLGLRAVTVGTDMHGYKPLLDHGKVRFALIDGAEITPGTVVGWLVVHMLVVGSILGVLLAVSWRRRTRCSVV